MNDRGILWNLVDWSIFISVGGMLISVSLQVVTRLFLQSLPWTEEMTRNLFIWTVFFGMATGFRTVEHSRITFMIKFIPEKFKMLQVYIYLIAGTAFFIIVAYQGIKMSVRQFINGEFSPALGLPMFIVTMPVAIGSLLAIIAHVQSVFYDAREKGKLMNPDSLGSVP